MGGGGGEKEWEGCDGEREWVSNCEGEKREKKEGRMEEGETERRKMGCRGNEGIKEKTRRKE